MILSNRSGRIRTRELEEEALGEMIGQFFNHWHRERRRTAVSKMGHTTRAAKIRKQTVWSDWPAKLENRKLRWKVALETSEKIAELKSTREGTEGNKCCWNNWGQLGIFDNFTWKWLPVENCQRSVDNQWAWMRSWVLYVPIHVKMV